MSSAVTTIVLPVTTGSDTFESFHVAPVARVKFAKNALFPIPNGTSVTTTTTTQYQPNDQQASGGGPLRRQRRHSKLSATPY